LNIKHRGQGLTVVFGASYSLALLML